ncbi:SDR family NAD(P)-dependent oxidoreductase [Antrihabitans cavernicola]|uniref:SDR family oxidoreductase n=1 Tax=Antrihabitans cavernicola TaxID=2495913 RepID=A0A5A7S1D4_9NOCA|nr:SDR family oxidoreductase [Spelaeibacter cavernicola]KAA0016764.1 SDR family oxidoreductase [Spelaeibacter cavernicola]
MSLPNPTTDSQVVVTGASSGIGTELARGFAARGHNVALVARRRDRLDKLADELRSRNRINVETYPRDLGDAAQRKSLVDQLRQSVRRVSGLCNCAGFGTAGTFAELPVDRELDQIELNVTAIVDLTHAFVGSMVEHGRGAILNVASVAAFQPIPGLATYSATKAFVQTFSESVHEELRGTGVSCTVVSPGPVQTEWADIANAQAVMVGPTQMDAEDVAEAAISGMENGKRTVVPGLVPKAMTLGGRYAPRTLLLPALSIGRRVRKGR